MLLATLALQTAGSAQSPGPSEPFQSVQSQSISLKQAIHMALKNNLDAKFENADIGVARAKLRFEVGVFDPAFSFQVSRESLRRPENVNDVTSADQVRQNNQISAINNNTDAIRAAQGLPPLSRDTVTVGLSDVTFDQQSDRASSSLVQRTPWGMRFGFFAEANKYRNTFTGDARTVVPQYQTSTQFQVVQPLLKDFGPAAGLANVRTARIAKHIAVLTWKQRVMTSIQAVMATYYDMLFGTADISVRTEAILADQNLVHNYQRRMEVGFMQPFDVQQARAQVSVDEELLISAKNGLLERQFALKRLILDQFDVNDAKIFLPMAEAALKVPTLDRAALLQQAFANRLDFQMVLAEADAQDIRLRFARNQMLPQLDLVATYGLNGLQEDYSSSFDQGFANRTPAWTVGVNLRIPLGNIQGRAQVALARAQKEQAIIKIKQSELAIGVDIDTVLSRIITNRKRLETARKTRELYEEAVRIAYRRLDQGQISTADIIDQQRRLYDSKSRELAAVAEINKSVTQLWLVTGCVLEKTGIQVDEGAGK